MTVQTKTPDACSIFNAQRLRAALGWRLREAGRNFSRFFGATDTQWARVIMDRETRSFVSTLDVRSLSALEISGTKWGGAGFGEYQSVAYPEYDVCREPRRVAAYDVIFAEQVFEHVLWPFRAARHVYQMLRPGGVFVITTPFLLRLHDCPVDCCRWTELGIKQLLAEGGFSIDRIQTGSWGNRACVRANFSRWRKWIPWLHTLENEPNFPVVIWAFARK